MNKFNAQFMHSILSSLCKEQETYKYPVYCDFGHGRGIPNSVIDYEYGFLTITDHQRIIMVKCDILGNVKKILSWPLKHISSLKISKTIYGQTKIALELTLDGKKTKAKAHIARKVIAMDLPEQTANHDNLVSALKIYER